MNKDLEKLLDNKSLFYNGLEDLSKFRSIMTYSNDSEMKELQIKFDKGFKQLRDIFQGAMDKKAANMC